jgi:ribosomal 50S subunit-recycling heat shock protein
MKIEILKDTVAGQKAVKAGDQLVVSDKEAKFLINIKKAKAAANEAPVEAQTQAEPEAEPVAEEAPSEAEEKPKKKGKK